MGPVDELDAAVIAELARFPGSAAFVTQLARRVPHAMRAAADTQLDESLRRLADDGRVVVMSHRPPDPHLDGADLRVVTAVGIGDPADAAARGERIWAAWLSEFVANHRCE